MELVDFTQNIHTKTKLRPACIEALILKLELRIRKQTDRTRVSSVDRQRRAKIRNISRDAGVAQGNAELNMILEIFFDFPSIIMQRFCFIQVKLKKELRELIKERSGVNPVETFAQYARINRKIDRVRERLGEINLDNSKYIYKVRLIATIILYVLISSVNSYLIWNYR